MKLTAEFAEKENGSAVSCSVGRRTPSINSLIKEPIVPVSCPAVEIACPEWPNERCSEAVNSRNIESVLRRTHAGRVGYSGQMPAARPTYRPTVRKLADTLLPVCLSECRRRPTFGLHVGCRPHTRHR